MCMRRVPDRDSLGTINVMDLEGDLVEIRYVVICLFVSVLLLTSVDGRVQITTIENRIICTGNQG